MTREVFLNSNSGELIVRCVCPSLLRTDVGGMPLDDHAEVARLPGGEKLLSVSRCKVSDFFV